MINEQDEQPLFCHPNKYGYVLNLRHRLINKLYFRYKDKHNIPHWCPLSDNERQEFETVVIDYLKGKGSNLMNDSECAPQIDYKMATA
jgi:hypothetical protein